MAKNYRTTQNDRRLKRRRLIFMHKDFGLSAGIWKQRWAGNSKVGYCDGLLQKGNDILSMLLQFGDDDRKTLCEGYSAFSLASLRHYLPVDRPPEGFFSTVDGGLHEIRANDERPGRLQIAPDIFAEGDSIGVLEHHSISQKPLETGSNGPHGKLEFLERDQALSVTVPQFQRPFDFELTPRSQAFSTHPPVDQLLETSLRLAVLVFVFHNFGIRFFA